MNALIVASIMAMTFSGVYLLLSHKLWKVIIGTAFLSHAVNLLLLSTGGYLPSANPPILTSSTTRYMDPLPQALILTAIVISFGVTAFILIVFRQVYKSLDTTDLSRVEEREWRDSEHGEHHD